MFFKILIIRFYYTVYVSFSKRPLSSSSSYYHLYEHLNYYANIMRHHVLKQDLIVLAGKVYSFLVLIYNILNEIFNL